MKTLSGNLLLRFFLISLISLLALGVTSATLIGKTGALQSSVHVAIGVGAALLLGILVFIVDRGWKTIRIHQDEIHRRLNEAQDLNARLKAEIEERNQVRQALTETQLRYETLVNSIDGIVYELDAHSFRPRFVSQQAERLLGYPVEHWLSDPTFLADRIHPEDREWVFAFCAAETAAKRDHQCEYRMVAADGRAVWLRDVVRVVVEHDQPVLLRGVMVDITERKGMEDALRHQAFHDALTGLPNRALVHDRLQQAILEAHRENSALGLLIMDLDNFKEVNDTLGHHSGDLLLQQVALRLRKVLRESDTVARLGGDEFAILLRWLTTGYDAPLVAAKIVEALQAPFEIEGQALVIGASIGIALYPDHGADDETLLRRADVAMYVAKRANSGYAIYAADQDQHSSDQLTLMRELRHAIDHDELQIYYQPKVEVQTGEVQGVEALIRWQHPQHGLLLPDQFIPLAERTGLIRSLTTWILDTALAQCQAWQRAGWKVRIGVNLSARNLEDSRLPKVIGEFLTKWDVPPDLLELEIAENALIGDWPSAFRVLSRLRGMGVRVAIDDFGASYASFVHLKELPVDAIKINYASVMGMIRDGNDAVMVRSAIHIGHNLGLKVVGAGVENGETWTQLTSMGCDTVQGYYLSRPLPAENISHWLQERAASGARGAGVGPNGRVTVGEKRSHKRA